MNRQKHLEDTKNNIERSDNDTVSTPSEITQGSKPFLSLLNFNNEERKSHHEPLSLQEELQLSIGNVETIERNENRQTSNG